MQYKGDSCVDTKVDPKGGIKYPYNKVIKFVRNLQYGFIGFIFVERKITTASLTARREHGPETMTIKIGNLF